MTNRAKPTVSDAFRLQLQVLVTVLGNLVLFTLFLAILRSSVLDVDLIPH